jgi:hypothetical protein
MPALDAWTALPLLAAAAALVLIALRLRAVAFLAALDGPSFARELRTRLEAGQIEAVRALATQLRPAWAAELVLRALGGREDPVQLKYEIEDARAELELAAERGLLAIRSLGRIALPLTLAIAILELGRGFNPELDRAWAAGQAFTRGAFVVSVGIALSVACQLSYAVLVREGTQRLREAQLASDALSASFGR